MMKAFTQACLWALLPSVMAQISYSDSDSGLQYHMSSVTTDAGTDLHMNLSIPSSHGFGAVGIGTLMSNSLIFLLVPDKTNGSTISLRTTTGEVMPTPVTDMTLDVISGSADNGVLMASAICRKCQTWSTGSLNVKSTSQPFVYSIGPGTSGVLSEGQNAQIRQHSTYGFFNIDMTKAAVSDSSQSSNNPASSSSGNSGVTGSSGTIIPPAPMLITAHSTILILTFALILPIGMILVRVPGLGWVAHAGCQVLGAVLAIAGMGIAISMSMMSTPFRHFDYYHQIIGLVAINVMLLNVFLGAAHHVVYTKKQGRSAITYVHLWLGRTVIPLGIINSIFGFLLTEKKSAAIGVTVAGLIVYLASAGAATFLKIRNKKNERGSSVGGSPEAENRMVENKVSGGHDGIN